MGPGEVYIDGKPFGRVESITTISRDEVTSEQWDELYSIYGLGVGDSDGKINRGWVEISSQPQTQEFSFNIPLTILPKRYPCKTLILTLAANQPYDYQAVDMSQYEERGLAHFIVGSPSNIEEMIAEYIEGVRNALSAEELQEEKEWLQEIVESAKENGMHSFPIYGATLLNYEALGLWDIEEDEKHWGKN